MMPFWARGATIGWPATATVPSLGPSRPATIISKVLLPQPDGPNSETNSPDFTVNDVVAPAGIEDLADPIGHDIVGRVFGRGHRLDIGQPINDGRDHPRTYFEFADF